MSDPIVRDRIVERCQAVLENDLGIAPIGAVFIISSNKMEEWIKSVLMDSGIVVDDSKIGVSIKWNPDFNSEIRSNRKSVKNKAPFSIKIGYLVDGDDMEKSGLSKKQKKLTGFNQAVRRQLISMMNGTAGKAQMAVMDNDALNKALARFCTDGKVRWSFADKRNHRIMKCKLDIDLVISAMFRITSEKGKRYNWDIRIVDALGPGTKERRANSAWRNKRRGEHSDDFTVLIQKRIDEQTYKNVNAPMKGIKHFLQ